MFAPAYNEWANVLLDVHEESSAYPLYQKALALDDTRAVYHHNIGLCCRRMGWEAEAEKHLVAALERDAAYAHSLEELGEIHLQRGDKERGMSLLHRANTPRAALLLQEWESPFTSDEQESENDCVVVLPHFLTTRECQHLRQAMDAAPLEWPTTSKRDASGYEVDLSRRRVFRAEVAASVNRMVRDRLESAAPMLAARFGAAVHGIEAPQLLRYETGHFFSYHQDVGDNSPGNNSRRVAIVVGLNGASRSSYRGGLLRLFKSEAAALQGKPIWQERVAEGTLVAFLATAFHDVTRVTSGRRYVSVSWLVGSGSDLLRSGDAAVRERADR